MNNPPMMMTAYASTIGVRNGPHQKSSGSMRPLPNTKKPRARAMFDGLNTCPRLVRMMYLVSRPNAAIPAK